MKNRKLRMQVVLDEFTRENLAIELAWSWTAQQVVDVFVSPNRGGTVWSPPTTWPVDRHEGEPLTGDQCAGDPLAWFGGTESDFNRASFTLSPRVYATGCHSCRRQAVEALQFASPRFGERGYKSVNGVQRYSITLNHQSSATLLALAS